MQTPLRDRLGRFAVLAFWTALLFAVVMALLPKPPEMPSDRFGDKFNHILAFATLAALAAMAYPRARRWLVVERLSFLGAIIEVAQSIPALHRDCDIRDWLANTLAVMVMTGVIALIARRKQTRRSR